LPFLPPPFSFWQKNGKQKTASQRRKADAPLLPRRGEGNMDKATQENLSDLVKRNYDEIAIDFAIARKKPLWPEVEKLAGPVKDGDRVLDVGCGNGRLLKAFGGKNINYLGVDNSKKLIEVARKNRRLETGNWKFVNGDLLELDKLPEKDFDYVFCLAVLHHLPGQELRIEALKQMKSKLKPGGKLVVTVWNLWARAKFRKLILKFSWQKLFGKNQMDLGDILFSWKNSQGQEVSQRYYHAFTKGALKEISLAAGLKMEKLYKDKYNYYLVLY
jgi:alkylated DNA repair protein alkB family protein 8